MVGGGARGFVADFRGDDVCRCKVLGELFVLPQQLQPTRSPGGVERRARSSRPEKSGRKREMIRGARVEGHQAAALPGV